MISLTKSEKYGVAANSYDILKFIAIFLMVIDHAGYFFFETIPEMRAIGRIAFPIFFFLIGYSGKTSSAKILYFYALFIVGLDILINFPPLPLNILFTAILCRFALGVIEKKKFLKINLKQIFLLLVIWYFATAPFFDYGTAAMMFVVMGWVIRKKINNNDAKLFFLGSFLFYFLTQYSSFNFNYADAIFFFFLLSGCFMLLYNFHLKKIVRGGIIAGAINIIARNSLHIYFFHLIIFKIIDKIHNPQQYINFQWFMG